VPGYGPEREPRGLRRQVTAAVGIWILALSLPYLTEGAQQRLAFGLQATALLPFISTQRLLTEARARADQIEALQEELDTLTAEASTQAALADENRTLRELLGLAEHAGPAFLPATVLRPGTPGSESMFLVDVGSEQGVREGAPVVTARGLVGRIREVRAGSAVGMDWTHPDFRASAMVAEGTAFGIVQNVRGAFREEDRLMLNGTAYHETLASGARVVTSGLGGVFPRGIPIGSVESTAEVQGTWRKSYWLLPAVEPGSVTHVLVQGTAGGEDLSSLWVPGAPPSEAPSPEASLPKRGSTE